MKTPLRLPRLAVILVLTALPRIHAADTPAPKPPLTSAVHDWSALNVTPTNTGERRAIASGPTATFKNLGMHATTLKPGIAAHPPHRHPDEEIVIVKEGTLEVNINGTLQRAGAGSVLFFAANDLHGLRNVGDTPATYHVLRIVTADTPKPAAPATR